jgi:hypothetical protein
MKLSFKGKICNKCGLFKNKYHRDNSKKDGFCTICSDCKTDTSRKWFRNNIEKSKQASSLWYNKNKNREDIIAQRATNSLRWRVNNPHLNSEKEARRRAKKLLATPPWLTDGHIAHIKRIYKLCAIVTEATLIQYHVDHILPLQGKEICGLHVPWNLRVIPAKDNISKGNRT